MTMRKKFLQRMRNEKSGWLGDPWKCFAWPPVRGLGPFVNFPYDKVTPPKPGVNQYYKNMFGVTYYKGEGDPGASPYITSENKVVKDISKWREQIILPDHSLINGEDWEPVERMVADMDRDEYLVMAATPTGMFEFSHLVMGFEDALVAYLLEPELMNEMLSAYTDWKLEQAKAICDHIKPDVIHSHDDWGSKKALFLNPDTWRKCIKPHFKRLYGYYKERGVLIQHHSDSVNHEVAEDMVELGIDMWQGIIPQNDIKSVFERTKGKLCLMGGIDMQLVDLPDASEEVIRGEVRRAIDEYAHLGPFIPCVTNIHAIYPRTHELLSDEMDKYGAAWVAKNE